MTLKKTLLETEKTVKVGAPVVATQLLQMSMGFVDTIMAGNLSAKDLAAVAVGTSLYTPILVFVIGILTATNPIVAQLHGGREDREIGKNLWQSLWLSQFLAVPCFFLIREMHVVMHVMNIRPEIMPITQGYLNAISWSFPATFAYFSLRSFNEGLSVTKPSMYFASIGLVFNIIGNYALMYGHFGFPAMGAIGTGWATTLVRWIMMFGLLAFTLSHKKYERFQIQEGRQLPCWAYIGKVLRIGVPNGISVSIEVSMFALAALLIGSFGVDIVAAHQIAINFAAITFMIPLGLSIATTSRVGFAAGKGSLNEARFIGYIGVALGVAVMSVTALIMFTVPEVIVGIYTDDADVIRIAVRLLFFAAVFQISDGLQVSVLGALRGLKDTKIPMIFNVIAYWVIGIPIGYVLGLKLGQGAEGLWTGLIAGLTVAAILHNLRFYYLTTRKEKKREIAESFEHASVGLEEGSPLNPLSK
ncbi:MATE family efflux transporter [candidate division KSB1 bacterium]|nr:MATE family efflux transporter [candidate division KSB1 bacterium]NIR73156.1 MATE family efflux transporter [candidate division KSB1 bacterium]NIS23863.1 MATE family efflux transporter [candidate division KSB1 bacterium]NIT70784.1 MATE family efflux transporter [candidate division KSB1 bacterium]NIU24512.1 MATE family efflux transporter [candidate division KSB1 bacterium]